MAEPSSQHAPILNAELLRAELGELHRHQRRTKRTAIFAEGEGLPASIEADTRDGKVVFAVHQAQGELDLRQQLAGDASEAAVFLVPFARTLPRDLAGRFASGRVLWPRAEKQLPRRFGARKATYRLLSSKLRPLVQSEGATVYREGQAPTVDVDAAWFAYLSHWLKLGSAQPSAVKLIAAGFKLTAIEREKVAARLNSNPEALTEAEEVLRRHFDGAAPLALRAICSGQLVRLAAHIYIGEAARKTLETLDAERAKTFLKFLGYIIKKEPDDPLHPVIVERGEAGLREALLLLASHAPLLSAALREQRLADEASAILAEAQKTLDDDLRALAEESNRLPYVFERRRKRFAEALTTLEGPSSPGYDEQLADLRKLAQALLRHDRAQADLATKRVVEMCVRIAGALALPSALAHPLDELKALAHWYTRHGAYLDWARQVVRADVEGELKVAVEGLLTRADQLRDEADRRFAAAYATGLLHGKGRESFTDVVPIEKALERFALDVVGKLDDVRLLVLCLDGMSWTNLVELWSSLRESHGQLQPVTLPGQSEGELPLPVVAAVPTVTELSRTALFAGRLLSADDVISTGKDPDRFAQHPGIKEHGAKAPLLLKGDVIAAGGQLSDNASKAIAEGAPIVGVVVNTLDEQLKGSAQMRVALSADHIIPLRALLSQAAHAGRFVLLCSDHGHVTSQRFPEQPYSNVAGFKEQANGARYRFLGEGEAVDEGEVQVPPGAYTLPAGAGALAVAVDERRRYTPQLHAGEHGGLSLAEAIAPCLLLAPDGRIAELDALPSGPQLTDLSPPSFWDVAPRVLPEPALTPEALSTDSKAKPSTKKQDKTLSLFPEAAGSSPAEVATQSGTSAAQLVANIARGELYTEMIKSAKKRDQERIKRALVVLIENGGLMSREAFARDAGVRPTGVTGFADVMANVLNVDSERVIEVDEAGRQVKLDVALLKLLFTKGGKRG